MVEKKIKYIVFIFGVLLLILFFSFLLSKKSEKIDKEYIVLKKFDEMSSSDFYNGNDLYLNDDNYLFLGDSITYFYDLEKYYGDLPVVNSGVNGDKATDILKDMKRRVYDYNPSKVFLLIGTNQIWRQSEEEVYDSIIEIVEKIRENRPRAAIYVESIYPVNKNIDSKMVKSRKNSKIINVNNMLAKYCAIDKKVTYIDIYSHLLDEDGILKKEYTTDGLHLSDDGYRIVTDIIKKYL